MAAPWAAGSIPSEAWDLQWKLETLELERIRSSSRTSGSTTTWRHPDRTAMRQLYVYILASRSRTLYVGVTNNIHRRVHEHRTGQGNFTSRYRICRLVYVEAVRGPMNAIRREKQIKAWRREKKVALIVKDNPAWNDLASGWDTYESVHAHRGILRERSERTIRR